MRAILYNTRALQLPRGGDAYGFLITRNIRCRKMRYYTAAVVASNGGGGARHVCRRKRRRAPGRRNRILFDRLVGIWGTVSCCSRAAPNAPSAAHIYPTRTALVEVTGSPGSGMRVCARDVPTLFGKVHRASGGRAVGLIVVDVIRRDVYTYIYYIRTVVIIIIVIAYTE